MPNNEEAHRALDRIGVKKGPLPERVMEVADIVESLRVRVRSFEVSEASKDVKET